MDPYHVTVVAGGVYLIAHCHLRGDVRVFAVERIGALELLPQTFDMPADFDQDAYLRSAWGIVRGELIAVRAVFDRTVAPHVRGRWWHASQQLRALPGGRLEVRLMVADTLEVRRWLMGCTARASTCSRPRPCARPSGRRRWPWRRPSTASRRGGPPPGRRIPRYARRASQDVRAARQDGALRRAPVGASRSRR